MNERSIDSIRSISSWEKVLIAEDLLYRDAEQYERLFYDQRFDCTSKITNRTSRWTEVELLRDTENLNAIDAMKNYDDDKIIATLNNKFVSIDRTRREKRTWNDSDIHKIHSWRQSWENWRTEKSIKSIFKSESIDVRRRLKQHDERWRR